MEQVIKQLKMADIFSIMSERLECGQDVKMTVTGNSMMPFLRHGKDAVEIRMVGYDELKNYDMVLIQRMDGVFVMHRIIELNPDYFIMMGDAQVWREGPIYPQQLKGKINAVYRGERRIDVESPAYKTLVFTWVMLYFPRRVIAKIIREARRCVNRIRRK